MAAVLGAALFMFAGVSSGQEGFPLDGTWRGSWGPADGQQAEVVIVMQWDGKNITGTINPGPDSIPFAMAALNPADWTVHIEADPKAGGRVVIDGQLLDIGSYHRRIEGTWTQSGVRNPFKVARE